MTTNTLDVLTAEQKTFYDRALLDRLLPELYFAKYGQKKRIPRREGRTINFRRFNALAPATTPLVEGVTPSGKALDISTVTATVKSYGDFIPISDELDLAAIDPVLMEAAEMLGEQAGQTIDIVVRDIVAAGTNVYYVGGGPARINVAAANVITGSDIRKIRRILARQNVKPYPGMGAYLAFVHPDVVFDIQSDAAWTNANQYAGSQRIFDGEIGKLYGVRFLETTHAPIFEGAGAAGIDVYGTIVCGADAYGVVDIAGSSKPEMIVKGLGSGGTADPLNQRATSGWKARATAARLQELAILRVESAVSA